MNAEQAYHQSWGDCRFCHSPLRHTFADLGMSPLCESYVSADQLNAMEAFYPLHAFVCDTCFLVQLPEHVRPEQIFGEYAYFSSYSDSWLDHARKYVEMITVRQSLGPRSRVVEIASNDGYLLQHFVKEGIPALGVEPAANVAKAAVEKGIPTLVKFFGRETAEEMAQNGLRADLVIANNVLAHVPDLNDFVAGLGLLLKPEGVATLEFPHLMRLMEENQYDTIYHEHFSYFSLITVERVFRAQGLMLFDVEELPSHGGSLRIYVRRAENRVGPGDPRLADLRDRELAFGLNRLETYQSFEKRVRGSKHSLLEFLLDAKRQGKRIAGYGAPGKGNTLLNYCGIRTDFLDYTVDRNPYKQGKYLPGTRIPIYPPEKLLETRPDYVLILPWNLRDEIMKQMDAVRRWGGRFVVPIPTVRVFD